jgi:hypothetical protein
MHSPLTSNAMGRFHNYSFGDILEIARQRPDTARVAGMYSWNQLGRRVKKGERGIHTDNSGGTVGGIWNRCFIYLIENQATYRAI